jgi:hypothetical protein
MPPPGSGRGFPDNRAFFRAEPALVLSSISKRLPPFFPLRPAGAELDMLKAKGKDDNVE